VVVQLTVNFSPRDPLLLSQSLHTRFTMAQCY
jgi:hypothetical protein